MSMKYNNKNNKPSSSNLNNNDDGFLRASKLPVQIMDGPIHYLNKENEVPWARDLCHTTTKGLAYPLFDK